MRKRVLTYSLAVAMAVAMAVPQTVILSTGIVQVKAANTETGLKTGIAITKAEWGKNEGKKTAHCNRYDGKSPVYSRSCGKYSRYKGRRIHV